MAVPRTPLACAAIAIPALLLVEYCVIKITIVPVAATQRVDWILACGCIAPLVTAFLLWLAVFIARIIADVLALLRTVAQWITTTPSHHPADRTPSSSTPSAVPPSSSYGWPSAGSSYTSRPGKEGHRMWP